ncbi:MAG: YjfB family protein [Lachnospiraceae bacterium]|nr:YjfB family protein [Lachnospiraceae bacterium]
MNIEGLSMGMSQTQLMNSVSTQVLAMSLDMVEEMGEGMIEMLEESMMDAPATPNLGANLDISI